MMQVTNEYLDDFAVKITGEPLEFPLNGWELFHEDGISVDDDEGTFLTILRWDDNPAEKQWKLKKGTNKRWTRVIAERNSEPFEPHGYEFPGLIRKEDIRAWYRAKLELTP